MKDPTHVKNSIILHNRPIMVYYLNLFQTVLLPFAYVGSFITLAVFHSKISAAYDSPLWANFKGEYSRNAYSQ